MKYSWLVSLLILGTAVAIAQLAKGPYYVPLDKTPEPGKAPGMQVQLLTPEGHEPRQYAVIFSKGDEVASGLVDFAARYHVTSAHFTTIGALHDATVAWMDRTKKSYKAIPIERQVEVLVDGGRHGHVRGETRRSHSPCRRVG